MWGLGLMAICFMYGTADLGAELTARRSLSVPNVLLPVYSNATSTLSAWDFEADNDSVQVIQTRFMQNQPNLVALGEARLKIFESFCLPSILVQSSQKFLWLIRTDPDLNQTLRDPLIAMLQPYPNILLVGSNANPEGFRLDASVQDISSSNVWSGSYELLGRYHMAAQSRVVIETRLDADDGLHFGFVEYTQLITSEELERQETSWLIYCAYKSLEWHHANPFKQILKDSDHGFIVGVSQVGCITPGLSFVYGLKVTRNDMPTGPHCHLHKTTPLCSDELKSSCIRHTKELKPTAIRARTPTSAGMENVVDGSQTKNLHYRPAESDAALQNEMWVGVRNTFGIKKEQVFALTSHLVRHQPEIVADNLKGQCTKGHSCKPASKSVLQELLLVKETTI